MLSSKAMVKVVIASAQPSWQRQRHAGYRDQQRKVQEVDRQKWQHTLEDAADGDVRRNALHDVEIEPNGGRNEAFFQGAKEKKAKPEGEIAGRLGDGKRDGCGDQH